MNAWERGTWRGKAGGGGSVQGIRGGCVHNKKKRGRLHGEDEIWALEFNRKVSVASGSLFCLFTKGILPSLSPSSPLDKSSLNQMHLPGQTYTFIPTVRLTDKPSQPINNPVCLTALFPSKFASSFPTCTSSSLSPSFCPLSSSLLPTFCYSISHPDPNVPVADMG